MNLLVDPILTLSGGDKVSLPALFAAMTRGEVRGFPGLRPHQRPAWHMFLVQLGALALWKAERDDLPEDAAHWTRALRGLTPDHAGDAPWRMVTDWSEPAFLQAPAPEGMEKRPKEPERKPREPKKKLKKEPKKKLVTAPDALDMLITARNHDLKQSVARQAAAEDWVYALVSLQTCEGYGGPKNYGVARMNGGSSSRPMLGLAPARDKDISVDPSAWWERDVRRLLTQRATEPETGIGVAGGPALLWLYDWPEGHQLDLRKLDPWFIEICRRVRLTENHGVLCAYRGTSSSARIDAKAFNGNIGDPWAPVHRTEGKSLTIGGGDFDYAQLVGLLFSGDWAPPLLAQPGNDESGDMLLVAEAFARGNSKTEGFRSRIVPVPGRVVPLFSSETAATLSKAQMNEIKGFDAALRNALALAAAGGSRDAMTKDHFALAAPARKRFDRAADRLFFPSLWRRVDALPDADAEKTARARFLTDLLKAAKAELTDALPAIPCPTIHRPRAEARARQEFRNKVRRLHPELFQKENVDAAA